jgi:hypothetical protein
VADGDRRAGGTRRGPADRDGGPDRAGGRDPAGGQRRSRGAAGEARGLVRRCADPGLLVTTWLAEEQRAEAAPARRAGLFELLTGRELAIVRLLPAPGSLREIAADLFVTSKTLKTHLVQDPEDPSAGDLPQAQRGIPGGSGNPRP